MGWTEETSLLWDYTGRGRGHEDGASSESFTVPTRERDRVKDIHASTWRLCAVKGGMVHSGLTGLRAETSQRSANESRRCST